MLAAGRIDSLRDNNYSLTATSPATAPTLTHNLLWLPQYAATFSPVRNLMLYGNYSVMLSLGPEGPWWADNASQFWRLSSPAKRKWEPNTIRDSVS